MSGSETISSSGVPARLRSMPGKPLEILVQRLAGVLLEMRAHQPDRLLAILQRNPHRPACHDRQLVLADLVALGKVGVEVVLARKYRTAIDRRAHREAEADRASRPRRGSTPAARRAARCRPRTPGHSAPRRRRWQRPRRSWTGWKAARGLPVRRRSPTSCSIPPPGPPARAGASRSPAGTGARRSASAPPRSSCR